MENKKFNFGDLNSFVYGRLCDLQDFEKSFQNKLIGTQEMIEATRSNNSKVKCLYNRLNRLKIAQESIDHALNCVQKNQDVWEQLLKAFEEKCSCDLKGVPVDRFRSVLYDKAEALFTDLANSFNLVEEVESKATNFREIKKQEPFYALFEVMNNNLHLLERVALHIQKLNNALNFNDHIRQQIIKRYYCNA